MDEPRIWEIAVPEMTVEELFLAQGADYSKRAPRPNLVNLSSRILEEAANLVRPTAIWNEVKIAGTGENEPFLEEGPKLTSKLLVKVAGTAEKLILLAMTNGSMLEDRIAEYNSAGQTLEAYTLDSAGSTILAKCVKTAFGEIEDKYKAVGMSATFPLGPKGKPIVIFVT